MSATEDRPETRCARCAEASHGATLCGPCRASDSKNKNGLPCFACFLEGGKLRLARAGKRGGTTLLRHDAVGLLDSTSADYTDFTKASRTEDPSRVFLCAAHRHLAPRECV